MFCLIKIIKFFFFLQINFRHNSLLLEQLLSLSNDSSNTIGTIALMKFYLQTRKFDDIVDYQLILSIIKYMCQIRTDGIQMNI